MLEANIGDKPYERSKQISAGLVKAYGSGWWLRNLHSWLKKLLRILVFLTFLKYIAADIRAKILVTSKGFNDERLNALRFRIG